MIDCVVQAAAHSCGAVGVQLPTVLLPLLYGFTDVIVMPNNNAFPLSRFASPRSLFVKNLAGA